MKKAIKLSLAAALAGSAMLQAASVDINGYRCGTLDVMFKGMTVIDDEKNKFAPSNGSGYLVKVKYESPDTLLDGLKYGVGVYVNGDAGLTNWHDNISSKTTWRKIMDTKQVRPRPLTEDQLEHVKKEITRIYFFLISKTGHDPMIVEFMKLSALADVQRRYESEEPWLMES